MSKMLGAVAAALVVVSAGSADAAQFYNFNLTGTLVSELGQGPIEDINTGVDPNFAVGETINLSARISSDNIVKWGDTGYSVAFFSWGSAPAGESWNITGEGLTWNTGDDIYDGDPVFTRDYSIERSGGGSEFSTAYYGAPAIVFADGKVVGVVGYLGPLTSTRPVLRLGSYVSGFESYYNTEVDGPVLFDSSYYQSLSDQFTLEAGEGLYNNLYNSQGFKGTWDFAGSTAAIPEPSTWAMLITGFGLAGVAIRRRRQPLAA
ncbi:PEPxxWA-CTERM sorting domain-containing protein [Phenylobacterium sp. LjRoot164]|uniref:PEPxxWA-CTERM sorting domain-containing protein n=1 Tax=unclassified Phenylobacterium TaxID=2640670 RepID=UPI003ED0B01E